MVFFYKNRNSFFILLGLSIFYVFPIMLANVYFIDDMSRVNKFQYWSYIGRPFADVLYTIISLGAPVDLFPLTTILSCIFITIALMILIKRMNMKFNIISYLIVLPVLCSPLFLENLSYRFDSVFMAFSILLAILSSEIKGKKYIVIKILMVFVALGMYQASINIYFSVCFLFYISDYKNSHPNSAKNLLQSILIAIIAYILYYVLVIKLYLNGGENFYIKGMKENIPFNLDGLILFFKNVITILANFYFHFSFLYLIVLIVLFLISYIFIFKNIRLNKNKLNKIIFILSPLAIALCVPGILLFMKNIAYMPRMLIATSIFIVFLFYCINAFLKGYWKFLLVLPYLYFFSLSYSYGASLSIMKTYNEYLFTQISYDLNNLNIKDDDNVYLLNGAPMPSQVIQFTEKNKFMEVPFILNSFGNDAGANIMTGGLFEFHNLNINIPSIFEGQKYIDKVKDNPTIKKSLYNIYKENNDYVIWFHKKESKINQ